MVFLCPNLCLSVLVAPSVYVCVVLCMLMLTCVGEIFCFDNVVTLCAFVVYLRCVLMFFGDDGRR